MHIFIGLKVFYVGTSKLEANNW